LSYDISYESRKMKFPIDSYDIKARYAPALLLSLPIIITFWTCFPKEVEAISKLLSGILSGTILYALSVVIRALGLKVEPELWKSWGGAPSTIIVSWSDSRLGNDLKAKIHQIVHSHLGLPMPSKEEEAADSSKAHDLIGQAFSRVKGLIRKKDKAGLWSVANAEYGFARNLYGSRGLWLIISCIMTFLSAGILWRQFNALVFLGFMINIVILVSCVILGWFILPAYTERVGFRYAEHAWESFLNIADKNY